MDAHTNRRCMIPIFSWRLLTRCHVPNSSSWLRTSQPALRRSFSTIFGTSNAFPYLTCYSPYHSSSKCGGRKETFQVQYHREFTGVPICLSHVSGLTFNHLDVAGSLQYISVLAGTLVETTEKLKADAGNDPSVHLCSVRSRRHFLVLFTRALPPRLL